MKDNLLRLYARNRNTPGRKFELRAEADAAVATLYVYDVIVDSEAEAEWFGGVAPLTFAKQLAGISAQTLHLRINSPGGSVFGARAMEQALRDFRAAGRRVIAHVDGYAASAASFLMLAADEIEIAPGAMVMIHKSWAFSYGNADDMLDLAALLNKIDGTLVDTYAARTGQDKQQIADWMAAETWFTAEEAVAAGFADRIAGEEKPDEASAQALAWDLTAYLRAAQAAKSEPHASSADDASQRSLESASHLARQAIARAATLSR